MPSISGMFTSRVTTSGRSSFTWANASTPLRAVCTSNPASTSMPLSALRISAESSTTRTLTTAGHIGSETSHVMKSHHRQSCGQRGASRRRHDRLPCWCTWSAPIPQVRRSASTAQIRRGEADGYRDQQARVTFVVEKGPDVADAVPPMERPADAADRRAVPGWATGAMDESGVLPLVGLDAAGRVIQMNQACAELAGQTTTQAAGRPVRQVLTCLDSELAEPRWAARRKDGTGPPPTEQISIDATGNRRRLRWTYVAVPPSADMPAHILGTGVDISRERLAEISSRTPSETDPLTNVANRAVFQASVAEHADPRTGLGCGVVLCELDGLEVINDSYDHAAVNAVLIQIASRLRTTVRDSDLIARIGDHTFAVVLPTLGMLQTRAVAL